MAYSIHGLACHIKAANQKGQFLKKLEEQCNVFTLFMTLKISGFVLFTFFVIFSGEQRRDCTKERVF